MMIGGSRRRFCAFLRPSAVLNSASLPSTSIQTIVSCGRPFGLNVTTWPYALSSSTFFTDSGNGIGMASLQAQGVVASDQQAPPPDDTSEGQTRYGSATCRDDPRRGPQPGLADSCDNVAPRNHSTAME